MNNPPEVPNAKFARLLYQALNEKPAAADAVIWLQGDRFDRAEKILHLYNRKFSPKIFLTGNNLLVGPDSRPDENNVSLSEMQDWLLQHDVPADAIVTDDRSRNTHEQAVNVLDLALSKNWQTVLLVASPYHQARAFLTFIKYADEIGWSGRIINQPADLPWNKPPTGRNKNAADYLLDELQKIDQYPEHVARLDEGIRYLS